MEEPTKRAIAILRFLMVKEVPLRRTRQRAYKKSNDFRSLCCASSGVAAGEHRAGLARHAVAVYRSAAGGIEPRSPCPACVWPMNKSRAIRLERTSLTSDLLGQRPTRNQGINPFHKFHRFLNRDCDTLPGPDPERRPYRCAHQLPFHVENYILNGSRSPDCGCRADSSVADGFHRVGLHPRPRSRISR